MFVNVNWYYYMQYRIYKFYQRYKGSEPVWMSFLAPTTLLTLNILTLYIIIDLFKPIKISEERYEVYILMAIVSLFHYLFLYRNKKHIDVFRHFDRNRELYRKWDLSTILYIVLSIVVPQITLYIVVRIKGFI